MKARACLFVLVVLVAGLAGCGDKLDISGPSNGGTQNIALGGGSAVQSIDSKCAGTVTASSGSTSKGNQSPAPSQTGQSGAQSPNCSENTAPPAFPPEAS